jgi:uncharacterized membrane protein (UPF0127 family)
MVDRRAGVAALLAAAVLAGCLGAGTPAYDDATVTVRDAATDEQLGTVAVRVADSPSERYTGLSETPRLAEGNGMLFVYSAAGNRTFVMRGMAYGLDIVFVGADGEITAIHEAPPPAETDSDRQYSGHARWVLEVPRGWTDERGVAVGDGVTVQFAG